LLVPGQGVNEEGGGREGPEEGEGEGEGGGYLTHGWRLAEEEGGSRRPFVEEDLLRGSDSLPSLLEEGGKGEEGDERGEVSAEKPRVAGGREMHVCLSSATDGADGVGGEGDQILEEEGGVGLPSFPPSLPPCLLWSCQAGEAIGGGVASKQVVGIDPFHQQTPRMPCRQAACP